MCNQGCKKGPHGIRQEGKRNDQVGTCAPGKGHRRGDYKGKDPPWGVSGWSPILGTPAWGLYTRKMSPLSWLEKQWTNRRPVRHLDSASEECAHTCLLLKQGAKIFLGFWLFSRDHFSACPPPDPSTHHTPLASQYSSTLMKGLLWVRALLSCERLCQPGTRTAAEQGGGSHSWGLWRQNIKSSPGL